MGNRAPVNYIGRGTGKRTSTGEYKSQKGAHNYEYRPAGGAAGIKLQMPGKFEGADLARWEPLLLAAGALGWRIRRRMQTEHKNARGGETSGHSISGGMWRGLKARVGGKNGIRLSFVGKSSWSSMYRRKDDSVRSRIWPGRKVDNALKAWAASGGQYPNHDFSDPRLNILEPSKPEVQAVSKAMLDAAAFFATAGIKSRYRPAGFPGDPLLSQELARVLSRGIRRS